MACARNEVDKGFSDVGIQCPPTKRLPFSDASLALEQLLHIPSRAYWEAKVAIEVGARTVGYAQQWFPIVESTLMDHLNDLRSLRPPSCEPIRLITDDGIELSVGWSAHDVSLWFFKGFTIDVGVFLGESSGTSRLALLKELLDNSPHARTSTQELIARMQGERSYLIKAQNEAKPSNDDGSPSLSTEERALALLVTRKLEWTKAQYAAAVGVSPGTVSRWEKFGDAYAVLKSHSTATRGSKTAAGFLEAIDDS